MLSGCLHERMGHGRLGRVETGGLLHIDSLEIDKPFASHSRDACAPLMQCNADSIGRDARPTLQKSKVKVPRDIGISFPSRWRSPR